MLRLALAALSACLLSVAAPAQIRVQSPQPTMLATDAYLFVMRGHEIFQFDINTLRLLHRAELPDDPSTGAEMARLFELLDRQLENEPMVEVVEVETMEEIEEVEEHVEEEPVLRDEEIEPGGAGGKFGGARPEAKGAKRTAASISNALQWLAAHQDDDGRWNADEFMQHDGAPAEAAGAGNPVHDVGLTGLALLAFLGEGNTLRAGPHRDNVKKAVAWLCKQQDPETGLIGTNSSASFIYDHSIATYALVEAYGLSKYKMLKANAQRAINYLERHRNPYAVWRYQPRDNDNDTSVTTWCVMAYKSAKDFDLEVNDQALKVAATWFDQVTDPETGRTGYVDRGGESSRLVGDHSTRFPRDRNEAMTAAGLFCRFLLGQDPDENPVMLKQANLLLAKPPTWEDGSVDEYAWLFGSLAMYQTGGRHWRSWHRALDGALLKNQRRDDEFAGSWDPVGVWSEQGGRIYSTAMFCLSLEISYRYARLVR